MGNQSGDQPASSAKKAPKRVPRRQAAFALSKEPVLKSSREFAAPPPPAPQPAPAASEHHNGATAAQHSPAYENLGSLPENYGQDCIYLVARDPRWLFSYWDLRWEAYPAHLHRFNVAQFFLRILAGGQEESIVEVKPEARNWYVPVQHPDTEYATELGFFAKDGAWRCVARSADTKTPPDALAGEHAAEFATVPAHLSFERLLELVAEHMRKGETLLQSIARITGAGRELAFTAGLTPGWTEEQRALLAALLGSSLVERIGMGSAEIDQLLRRQLIEKLQSESSSELAAKFYQSLGPEAALSSGVTSWGSSWSAQPFSTHTERGFFLHVNAEIIFYGGTHPDATLWIEGKQVPLRADGTFRYHFTLPDGAHSVPIVAQSPDGLEQRSATLSFSRGTTRTGEVGATAQPPELQPLNGKKA